MAKTHEITRSSNSLKLSADKIVMLPVSEVRPYEKNPRKNADAVKFVKASIEQFGFKVPIIVDSNRVIVCGHTRLLAAKSLGMSEVPCIMADDLTDEQVKAFRLADNKVGEFAEWDMDLLGDELDAIADACDIDMGDFGFDLDSEEEQEIKEDEVPEEVEPVCKKGEIWLLGEHRLMCGDSTDADAVAKLMNGERADCVFTDPPYGINLDGDYTGRGGRKLANFKDDSTQYAIKAFDIVQQMGVGIQVWFGANYYCHHLPETNNWLIWDKRGADGVENTNSDAELAWVKDGYESCRVFRHLWMGMVKASEHGEKRIYPTQKPIALWSYCFERYAPNATICLDLFGGSGSTMIACEQLGRKCRMMELDPHYCDVIIARWEKLTGQKAVKLEG